MHGDPGYPDDIRQYDHDPRSPFYNDATETAEFEAKQREMWEERMTDAGWISEAVCEASDYTILRLGEACLECEQPPVEAWGADFTEKLAKIGLIVFVLQERYNWPKDEDVIEALKGDGGE